MDRHRGARRKSWFVGNGHERGWACGDEATPAPAQGQSYLGEGRSLEAGVPLLPKGQEQLYPHQWMFRTDRSRWRPTLGHHFPKDVP